MAGARVYYTMAKDGLFFKRTGTLNKFAVPEFGLWMQCLIASVTYALAASMAICWI